MQLDVNATTREFVQWVARNPRTYAEAMQAWRSSCPRLTAWEDALVAGLIRIDHRAGVPLERAAVVLTQDGAAVLGHER